MADKPKLTGLSFNIYAIVGLLVILPISTAIVTNLSTANSDNYNSIIVPNNVEMANSNETLLLKWIDKGDNMTELYQETYDIPDVGNNIYNAYSSIWDVNNPMFSMAGHSNFIGTSNPQYNTDVNGRSFKLALDNHKFLGGSAFTTNAGASTNWQGYIGYSGDSFEFQITKNLTKFIDNTRDVSGFKFTFVDPFTAYTCDSPIFQEIEFKADIIFSNQYTTKTYSNFEYKQVTSYRNEFAYTGGGYSTRCHVGLNIDMDFTPLEDLQINDIFTNFSNTDINLKIYEISDTNYFDTNYSNPYLTVLPFTGDGFFGYDVEVAYVDTATTNFYLKGGTLLIGVALFALALASTPYWNPVTNALKPRGGM